MVLNFGRWCEWKGVRNAEKNVHSGVVRPTVVGWSSKHIEPERQNTVTVIRKINCLYRLAVIGACKKKKRGGTSRAQINRNQDLYFNVRFNKRYHIE